MHRELTPTRIGCNVEWLPPTPQDPNIGIYVSQVKPGEPGSGWPPKVQIMVNTTAGAVLGHSFWLSDEGLGALAQALAEAIKWRTELTTSPQASPEAQAVIDQIKESIP